MRNFDSIEEKITFDNFVGKEENNGKRYFFPFPNMFSSTYVN